MTGALSYRLPPPGWAPRGAKAPAASSAAAAARNVPVNLAWRTRQFWLLWAVLCLNVSAGIGVLGMASPMIQEVFRERVDASAAAGFAGLLSLFNIAGRIFWASLSDHLGRRLTYTIFFALGFGLYASVPLTAAAGGLALFVAIFCVILTMYGGGFATIPAYLADLFGAGHVSAIHGRLLTAWSTAGVLGPVLVNYIREFQIGHGVPPAQAYNVTMYVLAAMLVAGLLCNLAARPVDDRLFTLAASAPAALRRARPSPGPAPTPVASGPGGISVVLEPAATGGWWLVAVAWLLVSAPLAWGVVKTLVLAIQMFK
jgi:MFS family permease